MVHKRVYEVNCNTQFRPNPGHVPTPRTQYRKMFNVITDTRLQPDCFSEGFPEICMDYVLSYKTAVFHVKWAKKEHPAEKVHCCC